MYRLLKCEKDTYITSKIINGSSSLDANLGQAGTLDLYKLYNETIMTNGSSSGVELTRILLKFNLEPLQELTSSILNINDNSFKCYVRLKDVYGGQVVPSNFTVSIFPLAKEWDEGRGSDVIAYRDIDTANFLSASSNTAWSISGAFASGGLGGTNIDYYASGNLGAGIVSLECTQSFERGDEDLLIDVTRLVSGTLAGLIPNYGFRLSFTGSQETDSITRFVKRFGSRHTKNLTLRPKLLIKYNDSIIDDNRMLFFDTTNTVYYYNNFRDTKRNFYSGSNQITGSNSLILNLVASKSVSYVTTSYQSNFSASITHSASRIDYFSQSFTASQLNIGGNLQEGIYYSTFILSSSNAFFGTSQSVGFKQYWKSIDETVTYATGNFLNVERIAGSNSAFSQKNLVINITNLKHNYNEDEVARLRVFLQDYNLNQIYTRIPESSKSLTVKKMHFRLLDAYSKDIIIPFDLDNNSTLLSSDMDGMYFDLYIEDLDKNFVYELEFLIQENGKNYLIENQGYRFKVVA